MRSFSALLAPLAMAGLLTACDGEKADYTTDIYDISWVFVAGDATFDEAGIYLGVTAHPGARSGAATWVDAENRWLFGGRGRDGSDALGFLNDLWRYHDDQWIKVSGSEFIGSAGVYGTPGVPDDDNHPGARRDALSWTDSDGNFWLFGGYGYGEGASEGLLNDLWLYQWDANTGSGQWTWVGGSKTVNAFGTYGTQGAPDPLNWPGARREAAGWVEREAAGDGTYTARNLWLFGGYGNGVADCCTLNDVWRYTPADPVTAAGTWTWIKGGDSDAEIPVYGTTGVAAAANTPGGRYGAVAWGDDGGGAWLYGGFGYDAAVERNATVFAELWVLVPDVTDPANPEWNWAHFSGTKGDYAAPQYGARGVVSYTNEPGSRYRPQAWTTSDGRHCLFGGEMWPTEEATLPEYPSDLWCFDVLAWNWVGGTAAADVAYPVAGGPGTPPGRAGGAAWTDVLDNLWLFGGDGLDDDDNPVRRSDLWSVRP